MASKVRVEFNKTGVKARVTAASEKATFAMATQALKDSNYFAKQDQGGLIKSSEIASDLDAGLLVWDTPYAKKQYYTGEASTDVNPNATKLWAHTARAQYGDDWRKIGQNKVGEEM